MLQMLFKGEICSGKDSILAKLSQSASEVPRRTIVLLK